MKINIQLKTNNSEKQEIFLGRLEDLLTVIWFQSIGHPKGFETFQSGNPIAKYMYMQHIKLEGFKIGFKNDQ